MQYTPVEEHRQGSDSGEDDYELSFTMQPLCNRIELLQLENETEYGLKDIDRDEETGVDEDDKTDHQAKPLKDQSRQIVVLNILFTMTPLLFIGMYCHLAIRSVSKINRL